MFRVVEIVFRSRKWQSKIFFPHAIVTLSRYTRAFLAFRWVKFFLFRGGGAEREKKKEKKGKKISSRVLNFQREGKIN